MKGGQKLSSISPGDKVEFQMYYAGDVFTYRGEVLSKSDDTSHGEVLIKLMPPHAGKVMLPRHMLGKVVE